MKLELLKFEQLLRIFSLNSDKTEFRSCGSVGIGSSVIEVVLVVIEFLVSLKSKHILITSFKKFSAIIFVSLLSIKIIPPYL